MANPAVEVKDGAGAYAPTTSGVDVTPGNAIVIHLISTADVDSWAISCLTTDELTTPAAVNASLVIDSTLKTATFTAPAAGRAYRFLSAVNAGLDRNGVAQASYLTTFCVYTQAGGRRVHALDETLEGGVFGWMADINATIRSLGGVITKDMNNAVATLTAAEIASAATVKITSTAAFTANRNLTLPSATDAQAYERTFRNTQAGAFSVVLTTGAGTTVSIAQGKAVTVGVDSTGVFLIAAST